MKGKELDDYAAIEDEAIRKYITALKARSDGDAMKVLPGICNAICELSKEHARAVAVVTNKQEDIALHMTCLLYTSPSPRDATLPRMPSSA